MSRAVKLSAAGTMRVGQLLILDEVLRDHREMIAALFAITTLVHEERHESGRGKRFVLACLATAALFEELREGEEIPEYRLECADGEPFARPDWEARRVNSGRFGFVAIRNFIVRVPEIQMQIATREASRAPT